MKRFTYTVVSVFLSLITTTSIKSQVTIGSHIPPSEGALLDLKMSNTISTKGLNMPRVALTAIQGDLGRTLGASTDATLDHDEHIGLLIYNVSKNEVSGESRFCPGLHVWNGEKWESLSPYPKVKEVGRTIVSVKNRGFNYLDPNNANDRWPEGKKNTDYPLGYIGTFDDNRLNDTPQTYNFTRFYVGYKKMDVTYDITIDYSCSTNSQVLYTYTQTVQEEIFDDGVWMTQNLRALKNNDGGSITNYRGSNPTEYNISKYYHPNNIKNDQYGVLYNWRAAIGVGTSTGPDDYPQAGGSDEGGSNYKDVTYQGICPQGWYLPSDQEWTDLANGLAAKSNLFSSLTVGSATEVGYNIDHDPDGTNGAGADLGRVFKSTTQIGSFSSGGTSKAYSAGGFDAYLVGSGTTVSGTASTYNYGHSGYFWSSSYKSRQTSTNAPYGYFRWFLDTEPGYGSPNYFRSYHTAINCFSVRCKRIIQ